ncbi:unnamed protein product [Strongylus vulgaris]|uniref:UDP-glucuronosyltransferase n=1 Tax=Strongylus vulgaris TaxID=40348 RepID=A0A3P7KFZ3_STRVU|nr:unnamed protein product [Strongylus vulgaris]
MPTEMKKSIVETAKTHPDVTFVWKYEEPDDAPFAAGVNNLFLTKWTPQSDLLADNRLTLFVTHGGAGSLMESAFRGKPLIVVPLFADQTRNAKLVVKFGFGLMLSKENLLDSRAMSSAIEEVLTDTKYQKAAHRIRNILAKQTFSPKHKLIKTVELAAEFGEMPQFRVAGRNLGIITYYNLDIMLLFIALMLFLVYLLLFIFYRMFRVMANIRMVKTKKH